MNGKNVCIYAQPNVYPYVETDYLKKQNGFCGGCVKGAVIGSTGVALAECGLRKFCDIPIVKNYKPILKSAGKIGLLVGLATGVYCWASKKGAEHNVQQMNEIVDKKLNAIS